MASLRPTASAGARKPAPRPELDAQPRRFSTPAAPAAPPPIGQLNREDILAILRQVFSAGGARDRAAALREVAHALGYRRTGSHIRAVLESALLTAVRRGLLRKEGGALSLAARSIEQYGRDFLKTQFLAALGRGWVERSEAARLLARWLGFTRTGPALAMAARSLTHGLLREQRLETNGPQIRRR